jgi:hypothetical protein
MQHVHLLGMKKRKPILWNSKRDWQRISDPHPETGQGQNTRNGSSRSR